MLARVKAEPALRMREMPNGRELLQIPFNEVVQVEDWDSNAQWARIVYKGITGYSLKEYLILVEGGQAPAQETAFDDPDAMSFMDRFSFSAGSGYDRPYVVYQVTLKEKWIGTGSGNLTELEDVINQFYAKGYRLHTMSTSNGGSKGSLSGDRIQATLVFEKAGLFK